VYGVVFMVGRRPRVRRSRRGMDSYSKGHLFEEVVEKYFQYLGYRVERNAVKTGYSGARHEIDVLITKGDTVGVVEAKNYNKPIPKEWIIKAHHVAEDIGAKEVYVVSANGFTEDAVKTADILGVRLLDLNQMAEVVERVRAETSIENLYVEPVYKPGEAVLFADKFASRKLLVKTETPTEVELVYAPLYYIEGVYTYIEEEGLIFKKEVERRREIGFYASAVNGGLVLYEEGVVDAVVIPPLVDDEIELLKILEDYEEASVSDLIEETGWSRSKLSRILGSLIDKELIEEREEVGENGRARKMYSSLLPSIEDLEENSSNLLNPGNIRKGKPSNTLDARVSLNHVKYMVEKLYDMEVNNIKIIHVPLYKVKMEKKNKEAYRFIYLAGWIHAPVEATALVEASQVT